MADSDLSFLREFEQADLLTMRSDIVAYLVGGKNRTILAAGSGDVNVTKQWMIAPERWLKAVNDALRYQGYYTKRVTRTSLSFRCA